MEPPFFFDFFHRCILAFLFNCKILSQ